MAMKYMIAYEYVATDIVWTIECFMQEVCITIYTYTAGIYYNKLWGTCIGCKAIGICVI